MKINNNLPLKIYCKNIMDVTFFFIQTFKEHHYNKFQCENRPRYSNFFSKIKYL